MGCRSSKDALLKVDDSVQVGLKRAKKRTNDANAAAHHQGYVPPTSHPLIRIKSANSTLPAGGDATVEGTDNEASTGSHPNQVG